MFVSKGKLFTFFLAILFVSLVVLLLLDQANAQGSGDYRIYLPSVTQPMGTLPPPADPVNFGVVLDKERPLRSADVAIDGQNGLHFAYIADTSNTIHYAYCPATNLANCANPTTWEIASLNRTETFVQIGLTPQGQPRLWLKNGNVHPIYSYAECNNACTNAQNWTIVDLVESFEWFGDPREFDWHLDTFIMYQGHPRLVYNYTHNTDTNLYGLYYAGCDGNCTDANNWFSTKIAQNNDLSRPVLALSASGQPRIIGNSIGLTNMFVYMECNQACESAASWSNLLPLFPRGDGAYTDFPSWSLEVNQQNGGPRVAYHFADIGTYYMWCNSGCTNLDNWYVNDNAIVIGENGQTPNLALDAQGRPRLAFRDNSQDGLGYAYCDSNCESSQPQWHVMQAEASGVLDQTYPVPPFYNCTEGDWVSGLRPALALDSQGNPRIAFDGDHLQNCYYGLPENNPPYWKVEKKWWASRLLAFPQP